jgi:hypothetical protein
VIAFLNLLFIATLVALLTGQFAIAGVIGLLGVFCWLVVLAVINKVSQ